jgi:predicted nucleotidyltransferase
MNAEPNLQLILRRLRALLPNLRHRYGVATPEVFGSRVRADVGEGSDLDLLVTFTEVPDLRISISLENELSERLGLPIDLVMRRALKPRPRDRILDEAIPV